jgi:hypothetical protein
LHESTFLQPRQTMSQDAWVFSISTLLAACLAYFLHSSGFPLGGAALFAAIAWFTILGIVDGLLTNLLPADSSSSSNATFRPVFLAVVPCLTTKYKASNGVVEIHGLFGSLKGSIPLKGAHFSVHGGGLLNLGVGTVVIRGRNSEELALTNVSRAKSVRETLQRLASEA